MEIIGIVLLLGLFGLGVGFVYLFLQYIELLKAVKAITENISSRLKSLEDKLDAGSGKANKAQA
jgi:hypothetical protein